MTTTTEHVGGSTKPYLLRAIYQWAVDHHLTPQLLVDADAEGVVVPKERVTDGRIVLNIHPQSVRGLEMGNEYLLFSTRFAGKPFAVRLPVAAVAAIFCRENGEGIAFRADDGEQTPPPTATDSRDGAKRPTSASSPHLKLVK